MLGIGLVIPHSLQGAVGLAADDGIGAVLGGILESFELFVGHIVRIETRAGGLGAEALDEGLIVNPVPGTVVNLGEGALGGIGQGAEEVLGAEVLFPVNGVGFVGRETVQIQNLLSVIGDSRKVRSGNHYLGIVLQQALGLAAAFTARGDNQRNYHQRQCNRQFFHCRLVCFTNSPQS